MVILRDKMFKNMLDKYKIMLSNVKNLYEKDFDAKPLYKDKYLMAKVKSFENTIETYFHDNKLHLMQQHLM